MLVSGIFPPITARCYPDGKIQFRKLQQNVEMKIFFTTHSKIDQYSDHG
jgi:hypothetical protein